MLAVFANDIFSRSNCHIDFRLSNSHKQTFLASEISGRHNLLVSGIASEVSALMDPFNLRRVLHETTLH